MKNSLYIFPFLFLVVLLKNECVAQETIEITGINEINAQKKDLLKEKLEEIYDRLGVPRNAEEIDAILSSNLENLTGTPEERMNEIRKRSELTAQKTKEQREQIRKEVNEDQDLKQYFMNLTESMNESGITDKDIAIDEKFTIDNINYVSLSIQDYIRKDLGTDFRQK